MKRIETGTMLLLLLFTLSLSAVPVKMPTPHAYVPPTIQGYIIDKNYQAYTQRIMTTGKVYAVEVNTNFSQSVEVTANNGSYKLTDLRPGTYKLTASAGLYPSTGYAYVNTTLPYVVTVADGANLTNVNIPLTRGCKIEGFIRYISSQTSQPIRAIADNPWLKSSITWLNYSVEAYDLKGNLRGQYNSSIPSPQPDATTAPFSITGTLYVGLEVGDYQLAPWVFGYYNKTKTVVTATTLGGTISSIYINLYSGGIISGTISLVNSLGNPETPKSASDASGAIYGGNVGINVFDPRGILKGVYIHRWTASTLYAHQETTTVGSNTYYLPNYDGADQSGTSLSADMSSTGRKLWGQFVYSLTGISTIPACTWTIYYQTWYSAGGAAHCDLNILILKSDGTVRTTIGTNVANSAGLTTTPQTLSGTYNWADYTVVDQTDYLEIDYYCEVTSAQASANAYLRIDDNTLPLSSQTRVVNINPAADDQSTSLKFYVSGLSEYYNKTYTGRAYKDYGLADGTYTIRVYIRGYVQKAVNTIIVTQGGNATIRIPMTRGGAIIATVNSMLGNSNILWRYSGFPLRIYIYGYAWIDPGFTQNPAVNNLVFRYCGVDYSVLLLQYGYLPSGIPDGGYKLITYTYGYLQPTDVSVVILSGAPASVTIPAQLGCRISGRIMFRSQNVPTPLSENIFIQVGVFDRNNILRAYSGTYAVYSGASSFPFSINGTSYSGLDKGNYSVRLLQSYGYMQAQDANVTLSTLGDAVENLEIIAHKMGSLYGTIKTHGAQGALTPLSDVVVRTYSQGTVIETSTDDYGNYSLKLPVNLKNILTPIKYNVTFSKQYFINQTLPVETYSGATTLLNMVLEEVPEFPLGAPITLMLASSATFLLLTRKKGKHQGNSAISKKTEKH